MEYMGAVPRVRRRALLLHVNARRGDSDLSPLRLRSHAPKRNTNIENVSERKKK